RRRADAASGELAAGPEVCGWTPRPLPPRTPIEGRYCRLEPLDADRHAAGLFEANSRDFNQWMYSGYGPFTTLGAFEAWVREVSAKDDPLFHAIIDAATGKAAGVAALMRIDPANGVIEVGNIRYAPDLKRSAAATEAMYLLMSRAFDELGYRRYEWKCDSLNWPSRRAAERLGFTFEGIFRQHMVVRGRNRDTAWFSILDSEWPALKSAFEGWLAAENFDASGAQKRPLAAFIKACRSD
ncbi:MAG: GNAT family protein, partial [Pseudomonadota bacterium]|nr:GNAT family protein [Pseudomonadota bacterium]